MEKQRNELKQWMLEQCRAIAKYLEDHKDNFMEGNKNAYRESLTKMGYSWNQLKDINFINKEISKLREETKLIKTNNKKERTIEEIEKSFKDSQGEILGEMISDAAKMDEAVKNDWSFAKEKYLCRLEAMLDAYKIIFGYHQHRDITNTDDLDYAGLDVTAAQRVMISLI